MQDQGRPHSLLADAIEIPEWLESDRDTPYADRLHRDRSIAGSIATTRPIERVRAWRRERSAREPQPSPAHDLAVRIDRGRRIITALMLAFGALAGAGVASAVFHYDGAQPVNVVTVLAVLVLLQLLLIALSLLLMAPRVPGLRALQDLIGGLNPGAIAAAVYRRLGRGENESRNVLVWRDARGPAAARFARWQMLAWSQWAAIAFNLAVLATAAALIAFTDLAFGWSTTLRFDSDDALRLTNAASTPWSDFWPQAVPSAELIERSRFFRLESAPPSGAAAEALTGWWPFLLAAIVTYGLLPRILLFVVALFRLHAATARLLLDDPRVKALLDRMNTAEIQLGADALEAAPAMSPGMADAPVETAANAVAIVWANAIPQEVVIDWSARALKMRVTGMFDAGGGRDLAADEETIQAIAADAPASLLVFVRAWEAPLLDLKDFLTSLRAALGPSCAIIIAPVGAAGDAATREQRATWSRWVARIADPAMYLETGV